MIYIELVGPLLAFFFLGLASGLKIGTIMAFFRHIR